MTYPLTLGQFFSDSRGASLIALLRLGFKTPSELESSLSKMGVCFSVNILLGKWSQGISSMEGIDTM